jgi:hypothetical protein
LGRVGQIHDENGAAVAAMLGEIDRLGFDGLQNSVHLGAGRAVLDGGIELFVWNPDVH